MGFLPGFAEVTENCATNFLMSAVSWITSIEIPPFLKKQSILLLKKVLLNTFTKESLLIKKKIAIGHMTINREII